MRFYFFYLMISLFVSCLCAGCHSTSPLKNEPKLSSLASPDLPSENDSVPEYAVFNGQQKKLLLDLRDKQERSVEGLKTFSVVDEQESLTLVFDPESRYAPRLIALPISDFRTQQQSVSTLVPTFKFTLTPAHARQAKNIVEQQLNHPLLKNLMETYFIHVSNVDLPELKRKLHFFPLVPKKNGVLNLDRDLTVDFHTIYALGGYCTTQQFGFYQLKSGHLSFPFYFFLPQEGPACLEQEQLIDPLQLAKDIINTTPRLAPKTPRSASLAKTTGAIVKHEHKRIIYVRGPQTQPDRYINPRDDLSNKIPEERGPVPWPKAFSSIDEALKTAQSGDEIRVMQGFYRVKETLRISQDNITLIGGFAYDAPDASTPSQEKRHQSLIYHDYRDGLSGLEDGGIVVTGKNVHLNNLTLHLHTLSVLKNADVFIQRLLFKSASFKNNGRLYLNDTTFSCGGFTTLETGVTKIEKTLIECGSVFNAGETVIDQALFVTKHKSTSEVRRPYRGSGGTIRNIGKFSLSHSTFIDSYAVVGGAISNRGQLKLEQVNFINAEAREYPTLYQDEDTGKIAKGYRDEDKPTLFGDIIVLPKVEILNCAVWNKEPINTTRIPQFFHPELKRYRSENNPFQGDFNDPVRRWGPDNLRFTADDAYLLK